MLEVEFVCSGSGAIVGIGKADSVTKAQSVEHETLNLGVVGSSPMLGAIVRIGKGGFLCCKQGSAETSRFYSLFSLNLYKFTYSNYEVHLAIINQ